MIGCRNRRHSKICFSPSRSAKTPKQSLIFIGGSVCFMLDLIYNPAACIGSASPGSLAAYGSCDLYSNYLFYYIKKYTTKSEATEEHLISDSVLPAETSPVFLFWVLLNDFTFSYSAGNKIRLMYSDQPQKTHFHGNNISVEKNSLWSAKENGTCCLFKKHMLDQNPTLLTTPFPLPFPCISNRHIPWNLST